MKHLFNGKYRITDKDTHFNILLIGATIKVRLKTSEEARKMFRRMNFPYFIKVYNNALANDARQKGIAEKNFVELKKVEVAAAAGVPIEHQLVRTRQGQMVRKVWIMPWWKRALIWLKGKVRPAAVIPGKIEEKDIRD